MRIDEQPLPYYKRNRLIWRWSYRDIEDGCRPVHGVALSMDRAPPSLSNAVAKKSEPRTPLRRERDPLDVMLDDIATVVGAFRRFKTWLDTPDPLKPPKPAPEQQTAPPFDIQEIPGAMRGELMPVSAKLMERWFAGELNFSPTDPDEKAEIDQNGKPYAASMYDTTTIKLDWLLNYQSAKDRYDDLLTSRIRTPNAVNALRTILRRYKLPFFTLDAWRMCGNSLPTLHQQFQFQLANVGSSLGQKIGALLEADAHNKGVPTDLTGALGSFDIYAAIAFATFNETGTEAYVSGIYVYIKDNYTFSSEPDSVSQYLGHWSAKGVIVVPYNGMASYLNKQSLYFSYPVAKGNPAAKGNVYYPVHNSDFRDWAIKHQRGGDFIIYSDYRYVPISPPIRVLL